MCSSDLYYSESEKQKLNMLVDEAMNLSGEDKDETRTRFLKMYANPVVNALQNT